MGDYLRGLSASAAKKDADQLNAPPAESTSFIAPRAQRMSVARQMGAVSVPETDRAGFIRFQQSAVLVSDMSGFTSTTRRLGITHFASLIMRMRQLSLPILHVHEALFIGNEADNLIVVLPSPLAAAKAACQIQRVIQQYNDALPPAKKDFQIILNGVVRVDTRATHSSFAHLFPWLASAACARSPNPWQASDCTAARAWCSRRALRSYTARWLHGGYMAVTQLLHCCCTAVHYSFTAVSLLSPY